MSSLSNGLLSLRRYFTDSKKCFLIQLDLFAWHEQHAKNYYWVFIGNIALLAYKNDYIALVSYIGEYEYNSISELFVLNEHPVADASILDAHRAMGR